MDKYQKEFLKVIGVLRNLSICYKKGDKEISVQTTIYDDAIAIRQDDDISIGDYKIILYTDAPVNLYEYAHGEWNKLDGNERSYTSYRYDIGLDINNPIEKLRLESPLNLVDPIEISVRVVYADKEAYYAEQDRIKQAERLKTASIRCATGQNLVNIYFQPCAENYALTEITLYHKESDKEFQLMGKYSVSGEIYFKSITGLAHGVYAYVLKQLDKDGNVLIETEKTEFRLSAAYQTQDRLPAVNAGG